MAFVPLFAAFEEPFARERADAPPPGGGGAARLGFWFGFGFFLPLLYWLPLLPAENVTVPGLMYPALLLGVAYLSLYTAAAGWLLGFLRGPGRVPLVLAAPSAWVLLEVVRASGPLGFPWGSIGYSQWSMLPLIQMASLGGFWLVSFWVVLVNAVGFEAIRGGRTFRQRAGAGGALVALFLVPLLWGQSELDRLAAAAAAPGGAPTRPVVLIQPNTGNDKWDVSERASVIGGLQVATLRAARVAPADALVIWPETATPTLLMYDRTYLEQVQNLVVNIDRPLLTGFPDRNEYRGGPLEYYNAAGLFTPGRGMVQEYRKVRLVPFAEYMPLPGLNKVNFGQGNFTPGDTLKVFDQAGPPFGVLICIEACFPDLSRAFVRRGARFLVNVTNDQWFGPSAAPWQHLTMAVFRCVENRVGMARAANTGISCLIDPSGTIHDATPLFQPATLQGEVRLGTETTLYTRVGDWILGVATLVVLVGLGVGLVRRPARPTRRG